MSGYPPPEPRPIAIVPLLLAGAAFAMTAWLVFDRFRVGPVHGDAKPREVTARGQLADFEKTTIDVFERNAASVVHITSPRVRVRNPYGFVQQLPEGTGTGFVWDERGYVVTNYHVIAGRKEVAVRMHDQRELRAVVVGDYAANDIAVIKIVNPPGGLRAVEIGTSGDLRVGQYVLAIGNPFGLDQTLTTGVISALNRTIESVARTAIEGVIQVDAAINPGNSGGPLLDSAGRVIGMNTAIYSPTGTSAGIGFAVPIDTINQIVPRVISTGRAVPPSRLGLGVMTAEITFRGDSLLLVRETVPGLGAAAAGILGERWDEEGRQLLGDAIVAVDGKRVERTFDIQKAIGGKKAGDEVEVRILRGLPDPSTLRELTVRVRLGELPSETR
ncbi:MAG: trypsin-like peptidase domain-containing protein [Planctomycetes bacterium]|nr:trypsin-like peptidase domain-containing protein [Planctomycetota bacterium]